ncbi:hypothetical protein [Terrisporobacter sp.]|uniref:hypothetical protein n=1 Tax=Terrisporobacter sp. TaxID=1965305 RepID=UPI00260ED6DD|nr:hypothetical protein [Terrisporobacter sp.]
MRVLGVDYSFNENQMSVSMCRLSNENSKGGIDLENISTFKVDNDYDLASLIVNQVNNLNVQYVVVDSFGVGILLYDDLHNVLGDKVIGYKTNRKNEHYLVSELIDSPLLEKLGLCCYYEESNNGVLRFHSESYKNLEYLQLKSLALANCYIKKILDKDDCIQKSNMKCKLKLNCGFGEATIYNITDHYYDNGNIVIKQGDGEIKIKANIIDKVCITNQD